MPSFISESAIITDCNIGSDVQVWHFCNLYGCTIGDYSKVGSYTEIQSDVTVGKRSNVSSIHLYAHLHRLGMMFLLGME